ncbi:MAG: carbohydrate kinase family protein [Promethearchaeota archaeon]
MKLRKKEGDYFENQGEKAMNRPEILGVGEVCVDWTALVDHFPNPDEKIDSKSQDIFGGGVTANYCVAAARLGAKTGFFGAIGDDDYGNFLQKDFQQEGVDTHFLFRMSKKSTPVNIIVVNEQSGEKIIIQSPYMHTTIPQMDSFFPHHLNNVKLVHSSGIFPELTANIFREAAKQGIITSFDLEKQIAIWGLQKIKPILDYTQILLPNKAGAMQLTGTDNPEEAAQIFLDWGIKLVVITLGEGGAMAFTKEGKIHVPAYPVRVVDTTGAGDTFCGAFTYTYGIKKWSIKKALRFGVAAASLKLQKLGARSGMPTFASVEQFITENA